MWPAVLGTSPNNERNARNRFVPAMERAYFKIYLHRPGISCYDKHTYKGR